MKMKPWLAAVVLLIGTSTLTFPSVGRASATRTTPAAAAEPLKEIDWEHIGEYRHWLNRSTDPKAVAFRRAIAHGHEELAKEEALARKVGMPLTPQELQPPVPAAENAGPYLENWKGFHYTDPAAASTIDSINPLATYSPAEIDAARKEMLRNQASLDLLHRAAALPHFSTLGWLNPYDVGEGLPFDARMREAARALRAESYLLYGKDGRFRQAIGEASLGFRLSAQVAEGEPTLIGYLVGKAISGISLLTLRDYLYLAGPDQAVDVRIQQTLQRDWPQLNLQRTMAGESIEIQHTVDQSEMGILLGNPGPKLPAGWPSAIALHKYIADRKQLTSVDRAFLKSLRDLVKARIVESYLKLYVASAQPFPRLIPTLRAAAQEKQAEVLTPDLAVYVDVSVMDVVGFATARDTAAKDVVLLGAAVLGYKARTGDFPAAVQEAMPDAPTSPFDGKPYFYQKTADGFLVSVIPPGQPMPETPKGWKSWRVEFRYPAPAELRKKPEGYIPPPKHPRWPGSLEEAKPDLWNAFDNLPKH